MVLRSSEGGHQKKLVPQVDFFKACVSFCCDADLNAFLLHDLDDDDDNDNNNDDDDEECSSQGLQNWTL
ncbi:hypothetical protein WISP_52817 [Willisornis vidua]|uniref:Uncharacterized protein n=1 Tax=Willisornis vidua TaxID=1566151 RepID=A0ABQ9DHL8_9PASS|nr:hypothetical protein WISP_52817 [Willisornis vidua]